VLERGERDFVNTYEIRELRLASLRGDGALVPLLEEVEDVIAEAKGNDLQDVREELKNLQSEAKEREHEESKLFEVTECNDLEDVADGWAELTRERDDATTKADERRDALYRLQDAVTAVARDMQEGPTPNAVERLTAAVKASDDDTPEALRAKDKLAAVEHQRDQAVKLASDRWVELVNLRAELVELRAAKPKRTRKAKVTP
jgi:hypothetical protein